MLTEPEYNVTSMYSRVNFEFMEMIRCLLKYSYFMFLVNHDNDATSCLRKSHDVILEAQF